MDRHLLNKTQFYVLSFTWGLPLTAIGLICVGLAVIFHFPVKKHGWCHYVEVGEAWGGLELGFFYLKGRKQSEQISDHEFGHAIQNCFFGPFMIPLISVPSAIRYWIRRLAAKLHLNLKKDYDSIWFERQATRLGKEYMSVLEHKEL